MCNCKLEPIKTSGTLITQPTTISCRNMFVKQQIRVVDVGFQNQGTNSVAIVTYDTGQSRLISGTSGAGAFFSPKIPSGYFDVSTYQITFEPLDQALAYEHKLNFSFCEIVEKI